MGSLSGPPEERRIPLGIHPVVHQEAIPSVSDAVVMAIFRKGVKDPDLLKKMSRKQPRTMKELFDMANRYADQEDAMVE